MKFGLFQTPYVRPERTPRQAFDWVLSQVVAAEEAGIDEAWIGEHYTVAWESIPHPDLVLAAAARETDRIILAPGAHLAPYHYPGNLASRAAWLSHLSEGRYILGLATGVNPIDTKLHGYENSKANLDIMLETIDIMEKVWSGEPFEYAGEHLRASIPAMAWDIQEVRDMRPYGGGTIPISVGGASPNSSSIKAAGARGLMPMSFGASAELIRNHWETYAESAREAGREPLSKETHRISMTIFVADTDAEARRLVKEGPMARTFMEYMVPHEQKRAKRAGVAPMWDADSTIDRIIDEAMIVGSPETVASRVNEMFDAAGGWGTTLVLGHDFIEDPAPWNNSLALIAQEVAPRILPLPAE